MQKYIPFLEAMIERLQNVKDKSREVQLQKMQSLHGILSNSKRKYVSQSENKTFVFNQRSVLVTFSVYALKLKILNTKPTSDRILLIYIFKLSNFLILWYRIFKLLSSEFFNVQIFLIFLFLQFLFIFIENEISFFLHLLLRVFYSNIIIAKTMKYTIS